MNPVNRNTSGTETYSLNKGNLWFGVGGREYGPTSVTNFYLGISPPKGGYVIYAGKASGGQSNYVANNDTELVTILSSITSNTFADVEEALVWVAGQNDFAVISKSEPEIVTDGLVLNVDASSLLSYPTTESTWYDTSKNNNDGTLENTMVFQTGGWLEFDGTDDYITFGDINVLDGASEASFEVIFYHTVASSSDFGRYLDKGGDSYRMVYANPEIVYRINNSNAQTGFDPTKEKWYHTIGTYTSGDFKFYVNGDEEFTTSNITGLISNNTTGFTIGATSTGTFDFTGNMSKVRLYDKVLSPTEVKQNYYGGPIVTDGLIFAVDGSNLVSYESGSATAYSLTGSNDGTLNKGVSFSPENGGVLYFDGSDDYIEFTDNYIGTELAISNAQDYTLEAWIKVETSSGTTTSAATIVGQTSSTGYGFQVGVSSGKPRINYGARSTSNFYSSEFEYNEWIHVTLVKLPNAGCRGFLNGVVDTTFGSSLAISSPSDGALRLGNASPRVTGYYDGAIGPVRIYNRALSDEEVAQNYLAQAGRFT